MTELCFAVRAEGLAGSSSGPDRSRHPGKGACNKRWLSAAERALEVLRLSAFALLQQVRDVLSARSAVDAAAPLAAPRNEGVDVDGYLADLSAGRFKVTDRGEGSALPVLERVIERVAIVGELAQTLPALVRVPSEAELCIDG